MPTKKKASPPKKTSPPTVLQEKTLKRIFHTIMRGIQGNFHDEHPLAMVP